MRREKGEFECNAKGRDFMPESGLTISVGIVITLLRGGWLGEGGIWKRVGTETHRRLIRAGCSCNLRVLMTFDSWC